MVERTGLPRTKAEAAVDTVFEGLKQALAAGERIELRGFGVFSVRARKTGIGRNPRTGTEVNIAPGKAVRFKPGKELHSLETGRIGQFAIATNISSPVAARTGEQGCQPGGTDSSRSRPERRAHNTSAARRTMRGRVAFNFSGVLPAGAAAGRERGYHHCQRRAVHAKLQPGHAAGGAR